MIRRHLVLLVACALLTGCEGPPSVNIEPPIVTVASPLVKDVVDHEEFTGRTEAVESVDVRARVSGYLSKVGFQAGREVHKGDLLFEIDPRPYQADLERAEAELARADARVKRLDADLARAERLRPTGAIGREEYDKIAGEQSEAAAGVRGARAAVERAKLDLGFTKVVSPIDGRISRNLITVGNLVTADQTPLTSIVSMDPMYVYFTVDERTMLRIQQLIREGKFKSGRDDEKAVPVRVGLANEEGFPHKGLVDFVDNRIDPATGTLKVRAVLPNSPVNGERPLNPGLFTRVRVNIGEPQKAVLVSERALGTDQGQRFVYVVNDKNEVAARNVKVGKLENGLRVIEEGLKPGERVIVNGLQRVRPGVVVNPKSGEMTGGTARSETEK